MGKKIRFIHSSDVHLGHQQFNIEERFDDFGVAFRQVVDTALEREVDFVIIGGDFFHKRAINAETLKQAMELLEPLRLKGISVIAIEGNHDKAFYQDKSSWLNLLNSLGYLRLLKPSFTEGKLDLREWQREQGEGCITQIGGVRIIGLGYLGATTNQRLLEAVEQIEESHEFTVMLLHAAVGKLLGQDLGGVKKEALEGFKDKVDYIALGHIHARQEIDGWVFNPGSLENCHIDEAKDGRERGFYLVEIEASGEAGSNGRRTNEKGDCEKGFTVEYIPSKTREVSLLSVDVTNALDPAQVNQKVWDALRPLDLNKLNKPMVQINLRGTIDFSTLTIDTRGLAAAIKENEDCLYVEVQNNINLPQQENTVEGDVISRSNIEREVLEQLVIRNQPEYREFSSELVNLVLKVKELALAGEEAGEIVAEVSKLAEILPWEVNEEGENQVAAGSAQEGESLIGMGFAEEGGIDLESTEA